MLNRILSPHAIMSSLILTPLLKPGLSLVGGDLQHIEAFGLAHFPGVWIADSDLWIGDETRNGFWLAVLVVVPFSVGRQRGSGKRLF